MSEKLIERLNYFNGQRLEADDLRVEQEYHIQVQRWLMKTLFSPGVARGFDVKALEGGKKIRLEPGLALDDLGRAIILVAPVELTPQARLLCIRYAEHKDRSQPEAPCAANVGGGATLPARSGGGPERILSQPDIFWRADPPMHDTRELIIAELLLKADCSVDKVVAGARHRASPLPVQQVRQISFEGEKDIAKGNSKVIHFFIRGGRPNAVTLYLRAKEFSSLYYSELGEVTPVLTGVGPLGEIVTRTPNGVDAHSHAGNTLYALPEVPPHLHDVVGRVEGPPGSNTLVKAPTFNNVDSFSRAGVGFAVLPGPHQHGIGGNTGTAPQFQNGDLQHKHRVDIHVSTSGQGGQTIVRKGRQFSFLSDLQIGVGKRSSTPLPKYTGKILQHVKDRYPAGSNPASPWVNETSFNGNTGHALYEVGTGPIRLDLIDGLSFEPDEYVPYEIELSVDDNNIGGCIQYNLYVD